MAIREILELGHPLLGEACQRVADPRGAGRIVTDLRDTLAAFRARHGFGRGIAAPQIGCRERVIYVDVPGELTGALINPRIDHESAERFELWDDCFSFPNLMVRVSRAVEVRLHYQDENGAARALGARGAFSELLQHEIDPLDGVLAVERAVHPGAFATRAEWERRYR